MKKNILKKFTILFVLGFLLIRYNFVFANDVVTDTQPPVISLIGNANISLTVGGTFTDPGTTVTDNLDASVIVIATGIVDVNTVNVYTITYNATDATGNPATPVVRTVVVHEIVPPAPKENFIIRNGDDLIWGGQIDLPDSVKVSIVGKEVDSKSVLGVLSIIGEKSGAFSVSDLKDYGSMGLYLKCITPKDKTPLCENWQYAVGPTTPWTSIDTTMLSGGETVGIYFGTSHHVVLDKNNIYAGDTISATSEKYNYESNTWNPLSGVYIGLTLPNPNDEWNPTIVGTYPVDVNGNTKITITNINKYNLGIVEDYYFPSYSIVVSQVPVGGGGSSGDILKTFSMSGAISYLSSKQKNDGSFGDFLYTDWVAVGVATSSLGQDIKTKILDYFKNNPLNSSILTDNERHAMALMALGINPYSGTSVDYISKITNNFDGVQFGDTSLDNDDIFALIVLSKAGYNSSDDKIIKDVNYLISKQSSNGSWGSIDLTAAAIQALNNFRDINGVSDSISKALKFLTRSQQNDGGFGNSFSTSWAIQGLSSENALYSSEIKKADDYLISKQQTDGGLENLTDDIDNRIWATAYSIPALLSKSWSSVINSFQKIIIVSNLPNNSVVEKNVEKPIILDLPKPKEEVKKEEVKTIEEKLINKTPIKNKIVKNIKVEKPIIKALEKNGDTNNYSNSSTTESLPVLKRSIFSEVSNTISLKFKAFFSWLLVNLSF
jgi:hypothetical protein